MLKVCEPCLIVMTRCPRRPSSAASRTTSVVFPLCILPTTVTIGGRAMGLRPRARRCPLRAREVFGGVHVEEEQRCVAVARDALGVEPGDADVVVERDDAPVAGGETRLDRRHAPLSIVRARGLEASLGV